MYTIKAFVDGKEYMIHNPRVKALIVGDPYTTYCNALNMWIKSVTKPGDLDQIQWGAKVPEEFQNEVLKDYMKTIASGGIA